MPTAPQPGMPPQCEGTTMTYIFVNPRPPGRRVQGLVLAPVTRSSRHSGANGPANGATTPRANGVPFCRHTSSSSGYPKLPPGMVPSTRVTSTRVHVNADQLSVPFGLFNDRGRDVPGTLTWTRSSSCGAPLAALYYCCLCCCSARGWPFSASGATPRACPFAAACSFQSKRQLEGIATPAPERERENLIVK